MCEFSPFSLIHILEYYWSLDKGLNLLKFRFCRWQSKRMVAAIIWHARMLLVKWNFVGCVLVLGNRMAVHGIHVTDMMIHWRNRRVMHKNEVVLHFSDTCTITIDTWITNRVWNWNIKWEFRKWHSSLEVKTGYLSFNTALNYSRRMHISKKKIKCSWRRLPFFILCSGIFWVSCHNCRRFRRAKSSTLEAWL